MFMNDASTFINYTARGVIYNCNAVIVQTMGDSVRQLFFSLNLSLLLTAVKNKLECLRPCHSLIFTSKAVAYPSGALNCMYLA